MSIPIDPAIIANAVTYNAGFTATSLNICESPQDGVKCVPLQFTFKTVKTWTVNLGVGSAAPPITKISAIYVDASWCQNDVIIMFVDTGFQVRVQGGNTLLAPVITGKIIPQFYVIYLGTVGTGASVTDKLNIFCLNQFIPELSVSNFVKSINYGLGSQGTPRPQYIDEEMVQVANSGGGTLGNITLFTGKPNYYIKELFCSLVIKAAADTPVLCTVRSSTNFIYQGYFLITTTLQRIDVFSLTGMNIKGNDYLDIQFGSPAVTNPHYYSASFFGGYL